MAHFYSRKRNVYQSFKIKKNARKIVNNGEKTLFEKIAEVFEIMWHGLCVIPLTELAMCLNWHNQF